MSENAKQPGAELYDHLPEDLREARERVLGKAVDADRRGASAASYESAQNSAAEGIPAGTFSAPLRSMTPEERRAAGKATAKAAIEADPDLLDLGPDPDLDPEGQTTGSRNEIRFTNTKPDANGLTPQQKKELGKKHARAGISHSGSGQQGR